MSIRHCIVGLIVSICASTPLAAQTPDIEFFETKIRPVLAQKCYGCHNSKMPAPKGSLVLDSKEGLLKGGVSGPALVPGKPAESRLINGPELQRSAGADAAQRQAARRRPGRFRAVDCAWRGRPSRRCSGPGLGDSSIQGHVARRGAQVVGIPTGRRRSSRRSGGAAKWPTTKIDNFILGRSSRRRNSHMSPQADRRTLVTRAYVDLLGYKPTFEEVQAFINDRSPNAYERLIDRLLASPHYGERWARHWMDVARYAEDNPTSEATNPPYPFAWRYRDWIIEALNAGMPYDRFVKLQLAADLMPKTTRDDMRALGYVGAAPIYHHDLRLSGEVIGTFLTDDWDERIDAVSRGVLGVTMACARCHDHKFDPISQKDYYALMGVFASTVRVERPMFAVDPKIEQRYMWLQRQLFDLAYSVNLLGNEGTTFTGGAEKAVKWKAEMESLKTEATSPAEGLSAARAESREVLESAASRRPTAAAGRSGGSQPQPPLPLPPFHRLRLREAAARRARLSRT